MSAAEKAASPQKRPAPEPAAGAPEAKKAKPDLAAIKKQIEYYFSDGNLQNDAFFHGKISEEKEGWLDFHWIQSCNKIKAMGQPTAVLIEALKDSPLETKTEGEKSFVRRTATLPALSETARTGLLQRGTDNAEKKKLTAHDGGVLIRFTELPEGLNYGPIKEALRSLLPDKGRVLFATNVTETRSTNILLAPFDDDVELVEKLEVKVKVEDTEHTLRFEICYGDVLREAVKDLPKHIVKRREALAKNRQKQRQKPVHLAGQKFANMQTLRGKVKEIIMSRKDGQELIEGSPDTLLVRAILAHHPRATEKLAGLKGLKVDQSGFETNGKKSRCFHLIKEDGTSEDISMVKCLGEVERKLQAGELEAPKEEAKPAAKAESPKTSPKAEPAAEPAAKAESPKPSPKAEPAKAPESPKKEPVAAA